MAGDVHQLCKQLSAGASAERIAAAETLCKMGQQARPAAVALVRAAGDADEMLRECAAAALEDLGPPHTEDVSRLAALLEADSSDAAYWAATLLGRAGAEAAAATPQLARAVARSEAIAVSQRAAWALGEIGPPARSALPELQAAAQSDDARLRRLASAAIASIKA